MEKCDIRIGYIGIGSMGAPIARFLFDKGFDITVHDIRSEAMSPFEKDGVKTAVTLEDLVAKTDCIMICVEGDYQLTKLITGADGILKYSRPGQILIVQTTCKISTVQQLWHAAAAEGVKLIDAPVNGNFEDRCNGTLAVYVGGSSETVTYCQPLLNVIGANGKKVMHLGPVGYGELAALINASVTVAHTVATLEGMKLGRVNGISEEKVCQICKMGSGRNYSTDHWPYFDELMKSHRLGPAMCRNDRKDMLDTAASAMTKGIFMAMIAGFGELTEKVYYERAEYLTERDGYDYPKEMPFVLEDVFGTVK